MNENECCLVISRLVSAVFLASAQTAGRLEKPEKFVAHSRLRNLQFISTISIPHTVDLSTCHAVIASAFKIVLQFALRNAHSETQTHLVRNANRWRRYCLFNEFGFDGILMSTGV